jgi:hypothetical protein
MPRPTFQGDIDTLIAAALEGKRNERELRETIRQAVELLSLAAGTLDKADLVHTAQKIRDFLALPAVQSALALEAADQVAL